MHSSDSREIDNVGSRRLCLVLAEISGQAEAVSARYMELEGDSFADRTLCARSCFDPVAWCESDLEWRHCEDTRGARRQDNDFKPQPGLIDKGWNRITSRAVHLDTHHERL
jgi:hypothetical protein